MTNYLVSFRGTISTGSLSEIFSHSFAFQSGSDAITVANHAMTDWKAAAGSGANAIVNFFSPAVAWQEALAAEIRDPILGKVKSAAHAPFVPPLAGAAPVDSLPSQTALCISMSGGFRDNGLPYKGRSYLPVLAVDQTNADGTVVTGSQTTILNAVEAFGDMMLANGHILCIWSRKIGGLIPVNQLRVGNKFDTIRRRRNALPETYLAVPFG